MLVENEILSKGNKRVNVKNKALNRGNDANYQEEEEDELDFRVKTESEVIKVPKCTYANDVNTSTVFYFCQCSTEDFYPICEACALSCHKEHSPALRLDGIYTCMCGKGNHVISKDNERRIKEKKMKMQNQCFFSRFMDITPNRGYYAHEGNTFCAVCVEHCLEKKFEDEDIELCLEPGLSCSCEKHYEMNVINLNVDLISKPKFHLNLQNFNYNILSKIQFSKQMYIDYFTAKVNDYNSSPSIENSKNFFVNFINFKILELFSNFAEKWENKFFHVKGYLTNISNETLFKLMSFDEPISMLTQNDAADFSTAKFYFAEYVFNYIVRTYQLKFNNLWNVRTIMNMNLYQRFVYLQEIRNFFKFNYFDNQNTTSYEQVFYDMSITILELYENVLKINENFNFTPRIISYIFPTFNRILKYLIKYNVLSDELKAKYFELVLDTVHLASEDPDCDYHKSAFYIIKSILYSLVYRNDRICLNYIRNEKDKNNKKFVFMCNPESENICKIFVNVVNKFNRTEDLNRTIIYDFYVRKIFELMIGKNEFYIKSLGNLLYGGVPSYEISLLSASDVTLEMRQFLYLPYLKEIVNFTDKLNIANRDYFDYNILYEDYQTKVNDIFKELKIFLNQELKTLPDLTRRYVTFSDDPSQDETKIVELRKTVKYTRFFQKIEEFLNIMSEGMRFKKAKDAFTAVQPEYKKMILQFLFLLVQNDYENLCLLMNFKPKIFINTFIDVHDTLFDFLELIGEMLFSNQKSYQFDNYYFYTECMSEIVDKVDFNPKEVGGDLLYSVNNDDMEAKLKVILKNLNLLEKVMRLTKKAVGDISMFNPDPLNCVEAIIDKIRYVKSDQDVNQLLVEYFIKGDFVEVIRDDDSPLTVVEKFISSYFIFCNELIYHNLYFYGLIRDQDFIYELETVEYILNELNSEKNTGFNMVNKKFNIPVEIEVPMTRFFILLNFSFDIKLVDIENPMNNMFMKNIPKHVKNISLHHLSKNESNASKSESEILSSKVTFLLKIMKRFEFKFQKASSHFIKQETFMERKIFLLNFLEHCIVRPVFQILNQYLLYSNYIKGTDCYHVYEVTFYFLRSIAYFYDNIDKVNEYLISMSNSLIHEDNVFRQSSYQRMDPARIAENKKLLKNTKIYDFEEIILRSEIDLNIVQEILEESTKISKNEVKYFDLAGIYSLFIKNLEKVLKLSKEEKLPEPEFTGGLTSVYTTFKTTNKVKKSREMTRLEKLYKKYEEKVRSTYDNNLAMIKIFESDSEEEDIAVDLYQYILTKFADGLTDYNFYRLQSSQKYTPGEISKLNINNFKFQNVYILFYLNALFYHDSSRFQQILEDNIGEDYDLFFNFLTKNFIMSSVLSEVTKIYELQNLKVDIPSLRFKQSLGFEIATITIKFLQNICESHNQEFQNRFFNFSYNIEPKEYFYRDNFYSNTEVEKTSNKFGYKRTLPFLSAESSRKDLLIFDSKKEDGEDVLITERAERMTTQQSRKTKVVIKPHLESAEMEKSGQRELFEKKKQREKEELKWLEQKKVSFLNYICHHMRVIISHLHVDGEFNSSLISTNRELKNFDNILEIYQRFSDLVVEMVQGTSNRNFDNFYKRLPDTLSIYDETGQISNAQTLDSFTFIQKSIEVKSLLFETKTPFDTLSLPMKFNLFFTINNLINQELSDISLVKIFLTIFPPDKIMDVITTYVRGLYIKHVHKCDYETAQFNNLFDDLELNNETYLQLLRRFKNGTEVYDDEFFKLVSQMYLYLTILGEKYSIPEAERILNMGYKEIIYTQEEPKDRNKSYFTKIGTYLKNWLKKSKFMSLEETEHMMIKKKKVKYHVNNIIISSKFLNKIIHYCEFMIDSSNDDAEELKLKIIYFIIDPRVYLISNNNIETFFDEVDRSSSTTKLKSLIDKLNFFVSEVEYKDSNLKKSKNLKWMLEVDYKNVDFMNFLISLIINFILLIFLEGDALEKGFVYYGIISLAGVQILMNVIYLIIFLISKHKFYVLVEKSNYDKESLTLLDILRINIFDCFLTNDEIYLMILNIIIGSLGILSSYATFLFSLQLLTVIKFVPTIKEIVIAFKLRFSQLISMIGFLAILIYFYSNIGFYFLSDEFIKELDDGTKENLCSTLLECSITYFNLGVRAGGGIGDLLDMKPYSDTSVYWARWVTDMIFYITVILLLLNMINGVIVSTFSQIREESNEKEEDINNKCFICNIDRVEFEKRKIAFADHLKHEHNTKTYIRFLIYLKLTSEKDLDADQSFIIQCIKNRDVSCFPVLRSFSVGNLEENENEDEGEDD